MKNLAFIFTFIVGFSLLASEGGVDGGGGNAVVCRNSEGEITSARMLDLYEGEALFGLEYEKLTVPAEKRLGQVLDQIYKGHRSGKFEYGSRDYLASVPSLFRFLPEGVRLKPIDDSRHVIMPWDCEIEQVANYYGQSAIFVVSEIYNKFSDLDKLALMLHEGIFTIERNAGVPDSRYTRRVVANLLSKGFTAEPVYEGLDWSKVEYCTTNPYWSYDESKRSTSFYVHKVGDNWRLQFFKINGHGVYSKKFLDIPAKGDVFPPAPVGDVGAQTTVAQLEGLIDPFDVVVLTIGWDGNNGVQELLREIQWGGFDPGDETGMQSFYCESEQ